MTDHIKFGLFNALVGLLIGVFITIFSIGDGYEMFIFAAPVSVFLVGVFLWRLFLYNKILRASKVITVGFLTGSLSHYITFLIISIIMNACYLLTGGCTGSLGGKPASVLEMLTGGFAFSFFSLLFFGWITIPASILIGFILRHSESKKNVAQQRI